MIIERMARGCKGEDGEVRKRRMEKKRCKGSCEIKNRRLCCQSENRRGVEVERERAN